MDARRRIRTNKLHVDIKNTELYITRSEETITRIRGSTMGMTYIQVQVDKLKSGIKENKILLERMREDLYRVDSGELDTELQMECKQEKIDQQNRQLNKAKAMEFKREEKKTKKATADTYMKGIINASRANRQKVRDANYGQRYYGSVCESLPDYIKTSLNSMPNNKGYIWRGVWFFGKLEPQTGPTIMFENQRGGIKVIHEYTDTTYKMYEKKGKERKRLVKTQKKRIVSTGPSLMDYIIKK